MIAYTISAPLYSPPPSASVVIVNIQGECQQQQMDSSLLTTDQYFEIGSLRDHGHLPVDEKCYPDPDRERRRAFVRRLHARQEWRTEFATKF